MSDNLGKDSTWRKNLQDHGPSMIGCGDKRPGSDQPSSGSGKKTKKEIDKDHREKKKAEHTKLEEENKELRANKEELRANNHRLVGQVELLTSQLETTRKENASLIAEKAKIGQKFITTEELLERKTTTFNAIRARARELKRQLKVFKTERASGMQESNREINSIMVLGSNSEIMLSQREKNNIMVPGDKSEIMLSQREKNNIMTPGGISEIMLSKRENNNVMVPGGISEIMLSKKEKSHNWTGSYVYAQDSRYNDVNVCLKCLSLHASGACPILSNH